MAKPILIFWKVLVTPCNQACGAPFIDKGFSTARTPGRPDRRYVGYVVRLTFRPWRRNTEPSKALLFGWKRTYQESAKRLATVNLPPLSPNDGYAEEAVSKLSVSQHD